MEFFSKLQTMGITNATIQIMEKNGRMSVSFIPKYKEGLPELNKIKPIVISGPAAVLDEKFFENITVFTDNDEFKTNLEAAKKAVDETSKALADKATKPAAKKATKKSAEAPDESEETEEKAGAPKPPKEEKPKPPSKFKKYEDPILEIVEADGFEINDDNYTSLKDKVDMLSVMDRASELAKEWEVKLKQYKAEKSSLFTGADKPSPETKKENPAPAAPPAPNPMDDDDDDLPYEKYDDAIVE